MTILGTGANIREERRPEAKVFLRRIGELIRARLLLCSEII